jgi:hypothetical protein
VVAESAPSQQSASGNELAVVSSSATPDSTPHAGYTLPIQAGLDDAVSNLPTDQ